MYSFSFSQLYTTRLLNVQVTLPTSFLPFVNSKPYLNHIFAFVPELRVRRFRHSPTLNIARIFRYEVTGIYLGRETLLDCLAIVPHYRVFVRCDEIFISRFYIHKVFVHGELVLLFLLPTERIRPKRFVSRFVW